MCDGGAMEGEIRGRYDISSHTCMELSKLKTIGFWLFSLVNTIAMDNNKNMRTDT